MYASGYLLRLDYCLRSTLARLSKRFQSRHALSAAPPVILRTARPGECGAIVAEPGEPGEFT